MLVGLHHTLKSDLIFELTCCILLCNSVSRSASISVFKSLCWASLSASSETLSLNVLITDYVWVLGKVSKESDLRSCAMDSIFSPKRSWIFIRNCRSALLPLPFFYMVSVCVVVTNLQYRLDSCNWINVPFLYSTLKLFHHTVKACLVQCPHRRINAFLWFFQFNCCFTHLE